MFEISSLRSDALVRPSGSEVDDSQGWIFLLPTNAWRTDQCERLESTSFLETLHQAGIVASEFKRSPRRVCGRLVVSEKVG